MNRHFSESAVRLSPPSEPRDWGWVQGLLPAGAFSPGLWGEGQGAWGTGEQRVEPQTQKKILQLKSSLSVSNRYCPFSLVPFLFFFFPGTISVQLPWNAKPPVAFLPGISIPVRALTLLRV